MLSDHPELNGVSIGRSFTPAFDAAIFDSVQNGTMKTVYRGVPFFKSPFDVVVYLQLLSRQKPKTVIEVGTKFGGSALWFADMMSADGAKDCRVVSVDIKPMAKFSDDRILFLEGDANALAEVLSLDLLSQLPRPWLVVEDSSHFYAETAAVLSFFHEWLRTGDYIVVEDGIVDHLSAEFYRQYDNGPNRALSDFLNQYTNLYEIDAGLCDHFGFNVTYNPNGWLRRL